MAMMRTDAYQRIPWALPYHDILGAIVDELGWDGVGTQFDHRMVMMMLIDAGRLNLALTLADRMFKDGNSTIYEDVLDMSGMLIKRKETEAFHQQNIEHRPTETKPIYDFAAYHLRKERMLQAGVWWRKAFKMNPNDSRGEHTRLIFMMKDPNALPPWGEMEFANHIFMLFPPDIRCEIQAFLLVVLRLGWAKRFGLTKDTRLEIIKFIATRGGRDGKSNRKPIAIEY